MSVLDNAVVRGLLLQAWQESQPGTAAAHEEGGFVLQDTDGSFDLERWPRGAQNRIVVPPHSGCKRGDRLIVATFHTHPNPGAEFQQEPSLTDVRAVRDDPDLSHTAFQGEYVIAAEQVYRIRKSGQVDIIGETRSVLGIA